MMRFFWVKLAGVVTATLILFTYQTQAHTLSVVRQALDEKEQQISEMEKGQEEDSGAKDSAASESGTYKDGTYTGTAPGYAGDLTVEVKVSGGKITSIDITDTSDDKAYLDLASGLIDDIIEKQTTDVDTVSGATYSSNGIIEATKKALSGSGE